MISSGNPWVPHDPALWWINECNRLMNCESSIVAKRRLDYSAEAT